MCTKEDICVDDGPEYTPDTSYQYYLNNWYVQMDLVCTPTAKVGLMITMFFAGFLIGGTMYAFPDKFGRRNSLIIAMVLANISQTILLAW